MIRRSEQLGTGFARASRRPTSGGKPLGVDALAALRSLLADGTDPAVRLRAVGLLFKALDLVGPKAKPAEAPNDGLISLRQFLNLGRDDSPERTEEALAETVLRTAAENSGVDFDFGDEPGYFPPDDAAPRA